MTKAETTSPKVKTYDVFIKLVGGVPGEHKFSVQAPTKESAWMSVATHQRTITSVAKQWFVIRVR